MTLRRILVVAAVGFVVLAAWQTVRGGAEGWIAVLVYAAALAVLLVFERRRYRPDVDRSSGAWQATGEAFVDPTSGTKTAVFYNAETGERDYRPGA